MKKFFNGQINSITTAALLVALSSLLSRFLGIFRDRILAGEFGAGDTLDIYYAAFRLPDLIFNLLVLGALSAGFIPIFTGLLKDKSGAQTKDNPAAWQLANSILNLLTLALIVLSVLIIFFSPGLMKLVAPGFSLEKQKLTIALTRIMFLSPIFLGISSVFGGILQSFKRFFVYSLAPIMYNLGIIIGALYFVPLWGVYGLAWGVVFGAIMHLAIQVPTALNLGFKPKLFLTLKDKNIRRIGRLMVPRTLSLAVSQVNLLVITAIASTLTSGSLTIFNFANNLQSFPVGIFGISFAIAVFPTLSAQTLDKNKFKENFSSTMRQIFFFIIPSTVLLLTLRAQIIRVVLGTGRFDWQDTILTLNTLGFFSLSLFAQGGLPLLVRMFYARENSKTPFYVGLVSVFINVLLAIWLGRRLGVAGLALAFSLSSIINFMLLWLILKLELGEMDESRILISVAKFSAAALTAGLAIQSIKYFVADLVDMTRLWGVLTQGIVSGGLGLAVYFLLCALLRSEELFSFWAGIKRRLPWVKVSTGDQGEARGI